MSQSEQKKTSLYTNEALNNSSCSKYKKFSDVYNNLSWDPGSVEANSRLVDSLEPNLLDLKIKNEISKGVLKGDQIGDFLDDPFLSSVYGLKTVTDILTGIYVPYSKEEDKIKEFLLIYRDFFEIFYFEQGYIAYGEDLKNAEEFNTDVVNWISRTKLSNRSKFRLYRFIGAEDKDKDFLEVISVLSGRLVRIKKNRLIPISFNQGINRIVWLRLWRNYDANKQKFLNMYNTAVKCIFVNSPNIEQATEELNQLENNNTFYTTKTDENDFNENEYFPTKFTSQDEVRKCFQNNEMYFEVEAAKYGFPGKGINNKEERLTAQETFQSMRTTEGIQETLLRELNNIAYFMKKQFGEEALPKDFKFVIKGAEPDKFRQNIFNNGFNSKFRGNFNDEHNFGKGKMEEKPPKPPKPGF